MNRSRPLPPSRLLAVAGIVGAATLGGLFTPIAATAGGPTSTAPAPGPRADRQLGAAPVARAAQATTPTPTAAPTPTPSATPKEPETPKETKTRKKAQRLAASLAKDVEGYSIADVRRGFPVKFALRTGRAIVRLQVQRGERWSTAARLDVPKGKTNRELRPGKQGRKRLASATVKDGKVQARYAIALEDGAIEASAWKTFKLKR